MAPDERLARRPADDGHAEPTSDSDLRPQAPAAAPPDRRTAWAETKARAEAGEKGKRRGGGGGPAWTPGPARRPGPAGGPGPGPRPGPHAGVTARAVIGDQLRIPIMWCEMGSCISWHADPAALGEADNRARRTRAGWRSTPSGGWHAPDASKPPSASGPPARSCCGTGTRPSPWPPGPPPYAAAAPPPGKQPRARRPASGHPPASPPKPRQQRVHPAASAVPAGRQARRTPASTFIPKRGANRGPSPANPRYGRTAPGRPVSS